MFYSPRNRADRSFYASHWLACHGGVGLLSAPGRAAANAPGEPEWRAGVFSSAELEVLLRDAVALPTLGEWGMLFAALSLLGAGTSVILRRRRR